MPINLYIGQPRSGKSYEVVTGPILGSIRMGRRVVSNIAGLNYPAMRELLAAEGVKDEDMGELVMVTHEQVQADNFFRTDYDAPDFETFVQPGDLVALDEIWRFWEPRGKLPTRHMNFMRMHGHLINQKNGLCCEVVLITQALSDVNSNIRNTAHQTVYMKKMTALGLNKAYTVTIYDKASTAKSKILTQFERKYNPELFHLYKSHSQNQGGVEPKEVHVDKRGNILMNKRFVLVIPLMLLMSAGAFYYLYGFFHPEVPTNENTPLAAAIEAGAPVPASQPIPQQPIVPQPLATWRIVGFYESRGVLTLVMKNDAGITRYVVNPNIRIAGLDIGAVLGEEVFSNWSGGQQNTGLIP